jgi:putative DNA primase/helicase
MGLDVRAEGGYVVAPPSVHTSGDRYAWITPLDESRPAELPDWLLDRLTRGGELQATSATLAEEGLIPVGARNTTLASLAGAMRHRGMTEPEIGAGLKEVNRRRCFPPLDESEVDQIAGSICRYAAGSRRYKRTDYGNAERLVDRHGDDLRFVAGLGWFVWDGSRWRRDEDGEPMRRMKETVRAVYDELRTIDDPVERDSVYGHAARSESASRLSAALTVASTEARVVARSEELDAHPWLLTVANGTIDLRTGDLLNHRRGDLITKMSPVHYDGAARADLWERFLVRVTGGDTELEAFLRRAVGYSLTGDISEEKLFFAHGPAASGKSTFLDAIKGILGDYAITSDFETFVKRKGDAGIRNDVARLAGARMVVGIEVDEGKRLAEGLVKSLTGGDKIAARFLYKEHFEFLPRFKLWLAANHRPRVNPTDDAMWRRITQLPFSVAIPPEERDPSVKTLLRTDSDVQAAVLAWAVAGCLEWQEIGLAIPDRVRAYTEEYRAENDPLRDFLSEECVFSSELTITRRQLQRAYEAWCGGLGEEPVAAKTLASALKENGVTEGRKIGQDRTWKGVDLANSIAPGPDRGQAF